MIYQKRQNTQMRKNAGLLTAQIEALKSEKLELETQKADLRTRMTEI